MSKKPLRTKMLTPARPAGNHPPSTAPARTAASRSTRAATRRVRLQTARAPTINRAPPTPGGAVAPPTNSRRPHVGTAAQRCGCLHLPIRGPAHGVISLQSLEQPGATALDSPSRLPRPDTASGTRPWHPALSIGPSTHLSRRVGLGSAHQNERSSCVGWGSPRQTEPHAAATAARSPPNKCRDLAALPIGSSTYLMSLVTKRKSVMTKRISSVAKRLNSVIKRIRSITKPSSWATNRISSVTTLVSSVAKLSGSVTTLISSVTTLVSSLTKLSRSVTTLNGSVTTLVSSATKLSGSVTTLVTSLTKLSGSVTTLVNSLTKLSGFVTTLSSLVTELTYNCRAIKDAAGKNRGLLSGNAGCPVGGGCTTGEIELYI